VRIAAANFKWDDVGTWLALARHRRSDRRGNTIAEGRVALAGSQRTLIVPNGRRLIAALGVQDLVIVDTPDAVLVAGRDRLDGLRQLVSDLDRCGWDDVL
jgi:mannose-1-phosphate guanylyltransferase